MSPRVHMVGDTWQSKSGERRIVEIGSHPQRGTLSALVETSGSNQRQVLPVSELDDEIRRDTANYASAMRAVGTVSTEREENAARVKHDSWYGFTNGMTPLKRKRAADVLGKTVAFAGKVGERGALIAEYVREHGYRVSKYGLSSPTGTYFDKKAVTETGLTFAEWLEGDEAPR